MIASDQNNPEFVGAHNPDARLAVRFYERAVRNDFMSQKEGRPIFATADYVEINVPGDNTLTLDVPVNEDHKHRFPIQWARYQNSKGTGADGQIIGTPLEQWPQIDRAQAAELRALKFLTVDSIADASDAQMQRIGMIAGMAPHAFRDKARRFLNVARGDAEANSRAEEIEALRKENERIRLEAEERDRRSQEALATLQKQMATLIDNMPGKPGRKPKHEATA